MRIVVTGAAGRVGRHVVAELLAHDHEVHAFDRAAPPDDAATSRATWIAARCGIRTRWPASSAGPEPRR